jgi:HlyD family secretion protein
MKQYSVMLIALALASCSGNHGTSITSSGTIEGTNVNIGTEVAGKVARVFVDEGSRVRPGDTLAFIDDTEYRLQLQQAEANLASFDAMYRVSAEGSRKEDIVQAQAAFTTAETDYNRMKDLLASHTITQKQFDDSYARYVAAQQTYEKLRKGLRPEEVKSARDKRDAAGAQADLLRKKIRDCTILAPSAGIVTLRSAEPGELVTVGTNILRVTYLEKVKLTIYLNEKDIARIKLGNRATVKMDGLPDKSFEGTVTYISPSAEFTPKNVQTQEERTKLVFGVKIEANNPEGLLKPGLPADATVYLDSTANG